MTKREAKRRACGKLATWVRYYLLCWPMSASARKGLKELRGEMLRRSVVQRRKPKAETLPSMFLDNRGPVSEREREIQRNLVAGKYSEEGETDG